jgi:YHS domain-containing protein
MMRTMRTIAVAALSLVLASAARAAQDTPAAGQKPQVHISCPLLTAHRDGQMKAVPVKVNGLTLYACNDVTGKLLKKEPLKLLQGEVADPVTGKVFTISEKTPWVVHANALYLFASPENRAAFTKDPGRYTKGRAR